MAKIFNRDINLSGSAKLVKGDTVLIDKDGNVKANIQDTLAQGSIYVGNSSNVTSELDAKTSGQILVGSGTTLASVAVSGDVTMSSAGAVTIQQSAVEVGMIGGAVTADDTTQEFVTFTKRHAWDNTDPDGNNDIVINNADITSAIEITDVWMQVSTPEGGALTATLRTAANGGGTAISSAIDCNSTTLQRTTALAGNSIAALGSLYLNFSANPGTAVGVLYISYIKAAV